MVRGYHEYQKAWDIPIGEILSCEDLEVGNIHDTFAIATMITKPEWRRIASLQAVPISESFQF